MAVTMEVVHEVVTDPYRTTSAGKWRRCQTTTLRWRDGAYDGYLGRSRRVV